MVKCNCLTKCGQQCKNSAKPGSPFCAIHKNCSNQISQHLSDPIQDSKFNAVVLLRISGNYANEQTEVSVFLTHQIDEKVKEIMITTYEDLITDINYNIKDDPKYYLPIKNHYLSILHTLEKTPIHEFEHGVLPEYGTVSLDAELQGYKVNSHFKHEHDLPFAIDYHNGQDDHYFIEIYKDLSIGDNFDLSVFSH